MVYFRTRANTAGKIRAQDMGQVNFLFSYKNRHGLEDKGTRYESVCPSKVDWRFFYAFRTNFFSDAALITAWQDLASPHTWWWSLLTSGAPEVRLRQLLLVSLPKTRENPLFRPAALLT
ncbi:hypothetical protein RRG08_042394 [Elysia crispata]|uniref:Uncharacterized protein n=1 Tax=Elysia crispata TaxID=231223 RepID=A0AAE0ZCF2_9GAST|nr:hypothetical protein RRG08_042394 [Elysia crispata]